MEDTLLPCPFCGYEGNTVSGEPGMYEIFCAGCDQASLCYFHTEAMAVAAWNKRVTVPVPEEVIVGLKKQLADMTQKYKSILALNERNCEDALRMMQGGKAGMALAMAMIDGIAARDKKIADLEKELTEVPREAIDALVGKEIAWDWIAWGKFEKEANIVRAWREKQGGKNNV